MKDENEDLKRELTSLPWRTCGLRTRPGRTRGFLAILELRDMYQGGNRGSQDSIQGIHPTGLGHLLMIDKRAGHLRSGRWYGRDMPPGGLVG